MKKMIRKIFIGIGLAGLIACQMTSEKPKITKTNQQNPDNVNQVTQVSSNPKSQIDLLYENPHKFFEGRLRKNYTSNDLTGRIDFDFVLTRADGPGDIWTLESFHAPYHANPAFIYDSQLPISPALLSQFLEVLNDHGAVAAVDRNDKHITALSFNQPDFVKEYVRFNRQKTRANVSVPVFRWNRYIEGSLGFVDGYIDHKDMANVCGRQSTYNLNVEPVNDWGMKLINGRSEAKIFGCLMAWDGDLTRFEIVYIQLISFE